MYLNVGNRSIRSSSVIGLFDMDSTTVQKSTREFLRCAEEQGRVANAGGPYELPKSFVLVDNGVLLSPLNCATLQKRCNLELGVL